MISTKRHISPTEQLGVMKQLHEPSGAVVAKATSMFRKTYRDRAFSFQSLPLFNHGTLHGRDRTETGRPLLARTVSSRQAGGRACPAKSGLVATN